jgi:hypothetical protein
VTTAEQIAAARLWAQRLDIADWPTIWRVDDIAEPDITIGDRDIITIPSETDSEAGIAAIVLAYAYHNVPAEQQMDEQQLYTAALELTNAWIED